ncbi:MAG: DEAD/DEAH box helicase [Cytophagales bacterium]|nr:MAG: DEAD/DEAH box helicase [Cytophagales bacterium]TAF61623.1 MAG: DEAD/DEAH box helicase [Cytophagales bacterium]
MQDFIQFHFNKQLLDAIAEAGYVHPTPIQEKAIPSILNGQDLVGIAQTGTGKTAAYLLPTLMRLKYAMGSMPRALILAPTRELALQIHSQVEKLGKYTDLRGYVAIGGKSTKHQKEDISKGLDILVSTPQRFLDIYLEEGVQTKQIQILILDEADRMMDMGFMPQIRRILEVIPHKKRQNLLFSATMSAKVMKLSEEFVEFPVIAEASPQATVARTVDQKRYEVPNLRTKINLLEYILELSECTKALVFVRTRSSATNISKYLNRRLMDEAMLLHANKDQNSRLHALESFKTDKIRILVATDVAARGLDIPEVSHVINFDVPLLYEDYVHRNGRTGRAGASGTAITFYNMGELYHIERIESLIAEKIPLKEIPPSVRIEETSFEEKQEQLRALDDQRKKADPTFQGAFHEKKKSNLPPSKLKKKPTNAKQSNTKFDRKRKPAK